VVVGIGHERDETVLDLIAHTALKTPTAVAAYFVEIFQQADAQLDQLLDRLETSVHQTVIREKQHIYSVAASLPLLTGRIFSQKTSYLNHLLHKTENASFSFVRSMQGKVNEVQVALQNSTHDILLTQKQKLETAALIADLSDPQHVLKRGYSVTMKAGKIMKSADDLCSGDKIRTVFHEGEVESSVQ
jgi:exodeoxyribonuclease VII large subunit